MSKITIDRAVLEQALEALIAATPVKAKDPQMQADAIVALREALADAIEVEHKAQGHPCGHQCKYGNTPSTCASAPMDCQCAIDAVLAQPASERDMKVYKAIAKNYHKDRDAMAQPQQEPVAWRWKYKFRDIGETGAYEYHSHSFAVLANMPKGEPLYTSPPARKPLTDDEIHAIYDEVAFREPYNMAVTRRNIARAIEAAHGITS